mgnify:FL=1|jgi:hypothetical protein
MSENVINGNAKEEILIVLELLRKSLIRNGVSMAFNSETKELIFFDTDIYLEEKRFSGFTVPIEKLVR